MATKTLLDACGGGHLIPISSPDFPPHADIRFVYDRGRDVG
ncbi:hypothetical protein [Methanosarcina siciliae]|nr:hypothetical protein [Methanosarcina siciliae]